MREPIKGFAILRTNKTLHGRSVYRPSDVPGHNVFMGYSSPGTGDALDLAARGGTEVFALCKGKLTQWYNDATKKEVIYFEGSGVIAVYAHINRAESVPMYKTVAEGTRLGWLRHDLNDPHLHFELRLNGVTLAAKTPKGLQTKMAALFQPAATIPVKLINHATGAVKETLQMVPGGDHIADQGKLYVEV